ncbi:MAG TPA: hypothetical protein VNL39_04200 [Xanthobacteraceae bacterium]|nr:hypothetical protein [Xanthobacteraceae bacterium]
MAYANRKPSSSRRLDAMQKETIYHPLRGDAITSDAKALARDDAQIGSKQASCIVALQDGDSP